MDAVNTTETTICFQNGSCRDSFPQFPIICIANKRKELFGRVDDRLVSRLRSGKHVRMDKYHHKQLYDILSARAKWGLDEDSITDDQLYRIADAGRRPGVGGDADPVSVGASSRRGGRYLRSSADPCAAGRRVAPLGASKKHISGRTGPLVSR